MSGVSETMGSYRHVALVHEQAEAWFARLKAADCTEPERDLFKEWCAADPLHLECFLEAEHVWEVAGIIDDSPDLSEDIERALLPDADTVMSEWMLAVGPPRRIANPKRVSRWKAPLALAASIGVAAIGWSVLYPVAEVSPLAYSTTDQIKTVILADGSRVTLDVGSEIHATLSESERAITLDRGRALFDVFHDPARRFVVDSGAGDVIAHGTKFEVIREGAVSEVTLLEGSVSIDDNERAKGREFTVRLVPGQVATYSPQLASWSVSQTDVKSSVTWVDGFHVFVATPLGEAVSEINRYSKNKIRLGDASVARLSLSGSFKMGDAAQIASVLPAVLPVSVKKEADGSLVIARK